MSQEELSSLLSFIPGLRRAEAPVPSAPSSFPAHSVKPPPADNGRSKRQRTRGEPVQRTQGEPVQPPAPVQLPQPALFAEPEHVISTTLSCPSTAVGRVIGKGGGNLKSIQTASGARIDVAREAAVSQRSDERTVTVTGTPTAVLFACGLLTQVIACAASAGASTPSTGPRSELRLTCEATKLGWIIGPSGATVKAIKKLSGARIDCSEEVDEATGRRSGHVLLSGSPEEVKEAETALTGLLGATSPAASKAYAAQLLEAAVQREKWEDEQRTRSSEVPPPLAAETGDAAPAEEKSGWERRMSRHPDGSTVGFWYHSASGTFSW
jgi:predicted RNA-binding protein YlqC (UPF0109 family)